MTDLIIQAKDLTKFYSSTPAADHVSFKAKKGEAFGFLGANGAWETTTMAFSEKNEKIGLLAYCGIRAKGTSK